MPEQLRQACVLIAGEDRSVSLEAFLAEVAAGTTDSEPK